MTAVLRGGRPGRPCCCAATWTRCRVTEATGAAVRVRDRRRDARVRPRPAHRDARRRGPPAGRTARELAGHVMFMFQPGEEGGGGAAAHDRGRRARRGRRAARRRLRAARLSDLLECGVFAARPGPVLAAADASSDGPRSRRTRLRAAPQRGPVPAACEMVTALQTMVTRRFDVFDPVVLTVGQLARRHRAQRDPRRRPPSWPPSAPTARVARAAPRGVPAAGREHRRGHGLTADAEYVEGYPVTVNDAAEAAFAVAAAADLFGAGRALTRRQPLTGAEDFSFVLSRCRERSSCSAPARRARTR